MIAVLAVTAGGAVAVTRTSALRSAPAPQAPTAPAAVAVVAALVQSHDVPIYLRGVGTVIAYNNVLIRSQITGQLVKISFHQGQPVKNGDVLAQIDPRPYQAELDQAIANRDRDQAHLENAKIDLNRYTELAKQRSIAQQLADSQKAIVAQLVAIVKSDEAIIESAKVNLGYTNLTSPIDGVTGIRQIDIGNIIHPTDVNGLVDVTQIEPISLIFTLPEADFVPIQERMSQGPVTVFVDSQDGKQLDKGRLNLVDNQIIQTAGTIRLRAEFPNQKHLLWPGQLVNARLLLDTRHDGLTVPASVVQQGPKGAYAYVIKPDNTVEIRPITVAQISDGQALINSGLKANERVVVDGQYKLQPGIPVTILTRQGRRRGRCTKRAAGADPMNISAPFIQRPIATALLMVGLLVGGLVAYPLLPVAALPNVNYPTLTVTAQLPGADPQTVASTVASPLELQFGEIPGLTQMTSASALGYVQITLQFELSRQIDGAVSDTLSAIKAATAYLPTNMPYPPSIRKVNPADTPILVLAATSDSLPLTVVDAYAQNILLQKISQISGVGLVGIGGEQQPTVRVQVDPQALAARGINLEDVRTVLGQANVDLPKGTLNSPRQTYTLNTNDQLFKPDQYADLIIAYSNGSPVRVRDIGRAISAGENELISAWYNKKRAIILAIQRQPGANVIETVNRIKAMMPVLQASIPPAVKISSFPTAPRPSAPRLTTCSSRCC